MTYPSNLYSWAASSARRPLTNRLLRVDCGLYFDQDKAQVSVKTGSSGFSLSGNRNGGSTNNQGTNGNYWSSTANSANNAYNLNLNSSNTNVNPQNNNNKYNGFSVRCVAG